MKKLLIALAVPLTFATLHAASGFSAPDAAAPADCIENCADCPLEGCPPECSTPDCCPPDCCELDCCELLTCDDGCPGVALLELAGDHLASFAATVGLVD